MPSVVAVVSDMIFSAKIAATARELKVDTAVVTGIEGLGTALEKGAVGLVIVDMELAGGRSEEAVRLSADHAARPRVVAYHPHVLTDLGESARRAGAHAVLPRSKFNTQLPDLLTAARGP